MPKTNEGVRQVRGEGGDVKAIRFPHELWVKVEDQAAKLSAGGFSRAGTSEVVRRAVAQLVGHELKAERWYGSTPAPASPGIPTVGERNTPGGSRECTTPEHDELRRQVAELERELAGAHEANTGLNRTVEELRGGSRPDLADVAVLQAVEELRDVWAKTKRAGVARPLAEAIAAVVGALDARPEPAAPESYEAYGSGCPSCSSTRCRPWVNGWHCTGDGVTEHPGRITTPAKKATAKAKVKKGKPAIAADDGAIADAVIRSLGK